MRIAFSGSHRVGKTTLVGHVGEALPRYVTVEEPYHLLEEEGYDCAESPSIEDFEAQLERSIIEIEQSAPNVLFDRCPADILAYLLTHEDRDAFEPDDWMDRARDAMEMLDLVVFVPIEESDRIPLPPHEDLAHRRAVDEELHEILLDDRLGLGSEVLVVEGSVSERTAQVMARIDPRRKRRSKP